MNEFLIDPNRYPGRPAQNRSASEEACYDFLDGLRIPYDRVDHDEAMTIAMCRGIEKILEAEICKNLFLCNRQKTDFYLLLIRGEKVFRTKYLSSQLNTARLSFGTAEDMQQLLGVTPGSATVLGLMNDRANQVRLIVDRTVLQNEFFACHPCRNTSTVRFRTSDLLETVIPALKHAPTFVDLPEDEE